MTRRLIALRLALRRLQKTDLRYVVGYDEAVKRAATAEHELARLKATLDRVRKRAEQWAAFAPANDWGDTTADTLTADLGRAILATLDQPEEPPCPT